ncbi:MAG: hypothetical protein V3T72_13640 [Thermoanaerobaculia bacterium]
MKKDRIARLEEIGFAEQQLFLRFSYDGAAFATTFWYDSVDLSALAARFTPQAVERIGFHVAAFEIAKLASLGARAVDFGSYAKYQTSDFEECWQRIFHGVWAQWRYENGQPDYRPELLAASTADEPTPVDLEPGAVEVLNLCGGGKDSLVSMKLLERAAIPYASLAYSHTVYGRHRPQHALIDSLLAHGRPSRSHRMWIFEDFLDSPILELHQELQVRSLIAAETPVSVFATLPIALEHGYRYLSVGHERSADRGNLVWEATGEDVNHQWGKSYEAERLLDRYIQDHLVAGLKYFSLLKPLHDVAIFHLLRRDLEAVPDAHSCNVEKPWCKACAKCAYVWINYMAYLPVDTVDAIFDGTPLLDLPENQLIFRQLLGLESHTPFECIGHVEESRLAFALCHRKGLRGKAMTTFLDEVPTVDVDAALESYLKVHRDGNGIPTNLAEQVLPLMECR